MNNVKVSLLIPVYGVEKYIERCAKSLFEQTYENIECIFINDCTKDKSIHVLNQTLKQYPHRIDQTKIIHHSVNKGLAAARNTAINHCSGKFIMHIDADDYIDKNAVECLVHKQQEGNYDIVTYDTKLYKPNGVNIIVSKDINDNKLFTKSLLQRETSMNVCGRLIRLSLYKNNNISNIEGLNMGEDYLVMPQLAYYAKKIGNIHNVFYHYDFTNITSYCNNYKRETIIQLWNVIEHLEEFFHSKGDDYIEALNIGKYKIYTNQRIDSCINNDITIFNQVTQKQKKMCNSYKKYLSLPYKISLIIDDIKIVKIYIQICKIIRNLIRF